MVATVIRAAAVRVAPVKLGVAINSDKALEVKSVRHKGHATRVVFVELAGEIESVCDCRPR